jgi:hypothetical protein
MVIDDEDTDVPEPRLHVAVRGPPLDRRRRQRGGVRER